MGAAGNAYLLGADYDLGGGGRLIALDVQQQVPEPASAALLGIGLVALLVLRRRRAG